MAGDWQAMQKGSTAQRSSQLTDYKLEGTPVRAPAVQRWRPKDTPERQLPASALKLRLQPARSASQQRQRAPGAGMLAAAAGREQRKLSCSWPPGMCSAFLSAPPTDALTACRSRCHISSYKMQSGVQVMTGFLLVRRCDTSDLGTVPSCLGINIANRAHLGRCSARTAQMGRRWSTAATAAQIAAAQTAVGAWGMKHAASTARPRKQASGGHSLNPNSATSAGS